MAIGVAGEDRDAPPAELLQAAAFPVVPARRIEIGCDQPLVGRNIGLGIGRAEEPVECLPRRQAAGRHQLQPIERDMGNPQVERADAPGIAGQIGQDIAAARGDRHDMTIGLQRQRLQVDLWVFPDLGVNQAMEELLEQPFQKSLAAQRRMTAHGLLEAEMAVGPRIDQSRDSKLEQRSQHTGRQCQFDDKALIYPPNRRSVSP